MLQSSETAIGPILDFDKILVTEQIVNGTMPTRRRIEKPNGSNADLESSEPPSEVGEIGMVTKRKNIVMMLNIQEKKEKIIPDTRQSQRTACDTLKSMFSVLAHEPLLNKVSARRLTLESRKSICM